MQYSRLLIILSNSQSHSSQLGQILSTSQISFSACASSSKHSATYPPPLPTHTTQDSAKPDLRVIIFSTTETPPKPPHNHLTNIHGRQEAFQPLQRQGSAHLPRRRAEFATVGQPAVGDGARSAGAPSRNQSGETGSRGQDGDGVSEAAIPIVKTAYPERKGRS